ncbi:CoA-binding domain protein [Methanococcus vannielii SB]|uniref:acetate--CoA ligase (ADP-forming) n=1 Tax=Methanococcus vannielii (strain ATCC 35089 / DSM 1224 / JCM 13029 / OCM 148 / SB) TaxID=406327 RepID=A6URP1_METVS|nr:acetate--CoA ligase family protein [Methanococcus vannielii]ABR55163.1 CoA-binding domain protein [Methanococcus vannielii SB]
MSELEGIFNPKSVALIGATETEGKVGQSVMKNLMKFKEHGGKLFPVNRKYNEIYGIKCYNSILNIEDAIDLVILAIPAEYTVDAMEECGKKGIKSAIIITAGFSESDNKDLELKLKNVIDKYKIRTIGPNCLGVINLYSNLNASFSKEFSKIGNIAFISQSGAILTALLDIAEYSNLGFSKIVSMGNKIDIQEDEILRYLENDPNTKVIALYIEGLKDGKFISAAKRISRKKPVIVLKSGRSKEGAKAVSSHTGSLAGNSEVYNAAFKKSRVFNVEGFEDLVNLLKIFSVQPRMKSNRIAVVTNAGGFGVLAADSVDKYGLELAKFSKETVLELKKYLPETSKISNPLDLIGDADVERYRHAFELIEKDKNIDGLLVILTPQGMTDSLGVSRELVKLKNYMICKNEKMPIVASFVGGGSVMESRSYLQEKGIPAFICPELAVKALACLYRQSILRDKYDSPEYLNKIRKEVSSVKKDNHVLIKELLENPNESNSKEFLKLNGFNIPKKFVAKSVEEAETYAKSLGKVVMKVVSSNIPHKSDAGCVIINPANIKEAFETIIKNGEKYLSEKNVDGIIDGVLVEEYILGKEIIIGAKRDPVFGPVVMTGLGGIFVEVLKDVSFGISPITEEYAEEIIKSLKSYKILEGVRGEKRSDINYLKELMVRVGVLMEVYNEILEIDINPAFIKEEGHGGIVGDALIVIQNKLK